MLPIRSFTRFMQSADDVLKQRAQELERAEREKEVLREQLVSEIRAKTEVRSTAQHP